MNDGHHDVRVADDPVTDAGSTPPAGTDRGGRVQVWVNWILALLTVPGAAAVLIFALGAVMSTAACSDRHCPNLGPDGIGFDVLFYGAPVISALAIVISLFTARRRWGIVVPLCALALLGGDILLIGVTVAQ
jgi:hypothetical protein